MVEKEKISFSKFYLHEFYNAVDQNAKTRFAEKPYNALSSLVSNLKSEDDYSSGVELLAREHGTSELSIFLFDIIDRINEYPPTVVYDSMPEMVDDFVNTLEVMLEEKETLESLEKVNSSFGEGIAVEDFESIEAEPISAEPKDEHINFAEFVNVEFNNVLDTELTKQTKLDESKNIKQFLEILLQNLQNPQLFNAPQPVTDIVDVLNRIFAQPGSGIASIQAFQNINHLMPELIKKTFHLEMESPETITESINSNTLVIAEPEEDSVEKETVEEEIFESKSAEETPGEKETGKIEEVEPEVVAEDLAEKAVEAEEPSSIENLLSAYFQSEIDEYCNIFSESFENLNSDPHNMQELENLESKFHSFKEISMIHGYELLESSCASAMQMLTKIRTKKQTMSDEFFIAAKELLIEFRNSDKYKGKNRASEESGKLESIVSRMEAGIVAPDKKSEAKKDDKVEEEIPEVFETVEEETTDNLISYNDKDSLFTIFKEIWFDVQPQISAEMLEKRNIENSVKVLNKVSSAAKLVSQDNISTFCDDVTTRLVSLNDLSENELNNGCAILFIVQENVLSNLQPEFDQKFVELELSKFDSIFKKSISINDVDSLLLIIVEYEKIHQSEFKDSLNKILELSDVAEKTNQIAHFERLSKNLALLGLENLKKFPEFYTDLMTNNSIKDSDQSIINELDQSYKLFIENLENKKANANVDELVSTLKEVISEISSAPEEIPIQSEDDLEGEIPEEDLDQIFKDEAKNYIWKIEDAVALLETDSKHTKPFEEIEKNAHSLKASARLMGYTDITNICNHIENIAELHLHNDFEIEPDVLETIKSSVNAIISFIDGNEKDLLQIEPELSKIEGKLRAEVKDAKPVVQKVDEEQEQLEEVPLFTEPEHDEDLLDIFKEESSSFIGVLDKAIENLKKGIENNEEIHQFEYASHSLKTAAKMLGFREIGQIADGLEQVAESLYKGEINNSPTLTNSLEESITAIKSLSAGEKVPATAVTDIINLLDIKRIMNDQKESDDSGTGEKRKVVAEEIDPMVDLFLKEAWEMIEKINRDLVQFEKKHDNSILENLNRNVHTLKGSAQMMQFEKIGHIAHIVEDFLEQQIESKDTIPDDYLEPIFNAFDEIQNITEAIKNSEGEVSKNYEKILNDLGIFKVDSESTEEEPKEEEEVQVKIIEPELKQPAIESKTQIIAEQPKKSVSDENSQQIKISTERVDNLINMAAELVINKTQLINYVDSLKKLGLDLDKDRKVLKDAEYSLDDIILKRRYEQELHSGSELDDDGNKKFGDLALISNDFKKTLSTIDSVSSKFSNLTHGFEQNISRMANLIKMLHDDVLQVRMVPVENLFNRFPRSVRDLAKKQKKKVDLVIEGANTEMDRAMIESLTDPIMHLVRNSIDHGIELPMHRKRSGKENIAKLYLRAKQDKNQIIIEVEDDGKGINVDAVRETIIKKKILAKEKVEKLSTGEVLDYIFYPGFSTKKGTSKVSGRGIGLDVVASQVEKLKGDIRVNSTIGEGTTFSIRVPLTLIISQAMLFKLTDQILAVPLISVDESIQFDKSILQIEKDKMFINHRGEKILTLNLNSLLNFSESELKGEIKAILIQESGIRCALIVDELMHREEIVIKSLGTHLQNMEFISGGTILGDGTIALILDTTAIIRRIEKENLQKEKEQVKELPKETIKIVEKELEVKIEKKEIKNRKPIALIVDDSISVRRFVANTLEKNNYDTILASDGINALEELKEKSFDIVITDLEMPKMHGYELIEKIRKQKKLKDLPIVILTGRAGKKHKDMGIKLGANAFIVKPFKDNDLLSTLNKFIDN
jgi:chemosensory pili system protein ChpA (sensor histidine kinase/response regulator)